MDETTILRSVFDRINEMIFMTDDTGKLNYQNKPLTDLIGITNPMHSENLFNSLHPEDQINLSYLIEEAIKTKEGFSHELRFKRDDGSYKRVQLQLVVRNNVDRSFAGLIGFIAHVHPTQNERGQSSEKIQNRNLQLEESVRDLQKSNDDLEQFAYIASHDLQEPLRKIKFYSTLLMESKGSVDAPENKAHLLKIKESTGRMTNLIHDLLNFSIISKQKDLFQPVNLNDLLSKVLDDYDLLIAQKNAQVEINPLPFIEGNAVMLHQLFYNLIGNSLKFSSDQRQPYIRISGKLIRSENQQGELQDMVEIKVSDNGIGFPQNLAEKIFDLFTRLHPKSRYTGSGIGLALCRKITDNHHGSISAESNENQGASFKITLPIKHKHIKA